jgi:hypothetical protein
VAATYANVQGLFKTRYGRWIDPLPDDHTLADYGDFVQQDSRPGLNYAFPVLTAIEGGQTANVDNSAFTINAAIDSNVLQATLDGATILMQAVLSYDTIYKGLNGAGNGSQGGAFKTALDQAVSSLLMGAALYRELALAYGPGTSTALSSNIGVVLSSISGANLAAPQVVALTVASWIPGLWIMVQNHLVDIYQSDGTTPRDTGVTMQARPSTTQTRLQLFKTASAATVAANDVIVPQGWRTKSCFGLEAIYNNATTLFGINAATVAPWRCMTFNAGGQLTRAKLMGYGAAISTNGVKTGGKLFVCSYAFADLAEESNTLRQFMTDNTVRTQGASELIYVTACGEINVAVYQYAKAGQAMFIAKDNFRRVGSTDITMRPIGGGAQGFFTHSTTTAGAQIKCFSNQAPVFEMPFRNFLITGIVNSAASGVPAAT